MCTADLPRTVRRYCEIFGFQDAGGRVLWGERSARIQELGDDSNAMLWWLVGTQEFVNLEFFQHTLPRQRPLPAGWLPSCLGWGRWGLAVADFEATVAGIRAASIVLSEVMMIDGLRRACFRDPDVGAVVEIMEDGPGLPRPNDLGDGATPRIVYATLSVSDLDKAREFYLEALGMTLVPNMLHSPATEALWDLPGAERDIELLDGDSIFLELVRYIHPAAQKHADRLLSDQGVMNIALGYRDRAAIDDAMARAKSGGGSLNAPLADTVPAATYAKDPLGNSIEMLWIPAKLDVDYGWSPRPPAYR